MLSRFVHPRPEYPRPDFQRGLREGEDWLNLNGPWEFRFDPRRVGEQEQWFQVGDLPWREQIIVPFCWESLSAWGDGESASNETYFSTRPFLNPLEVTRDNHRSAPRHEVGWYRRWVRVPDHPAWRDKRIILHIGAADFFTDAWCEGQHLGHHEGGYTPFSFDLTDALSEDPEGGRRGFLVLRVEDPMENREQPVGKQWRWYTPCSGIWQTVFLEPRPREHIVRFRFHTDIDQAKLRAVVETEGRGGGTLRVRVFTPEEAQIADREVPVADGKAEITVVLDPLMLWDPNHPHLYGVRLTLNPLEGPPDEVRSYFGARKIDSAPADDPNAPAVLRLNNEPRYLRGALYQSYYPEGVYTAGEAERIKTDLEWAKKFGFNFLRIHIKIDDPILLYWADRLGILLMADFPNFGEGGDTERGRSRFETMMPEGIDRDFNHPSIIAWCLFNETWGFGGQAHFVDLISPPPVDTANPPPTPARRRKAAVPKKMANLASHKWVYEMWQLAKSLDDTRLVEDMSVCHWTHLEYFLHTDTDINSWHFYIHEYQAAKDHLNLVVKNTFRGSEFNYVPGFRHGGQPLINSEYGGVGALDGDRDISWSFKFLTNELRRHGAISAYIYTQLTDLEWEYNGMLNYDRTPKVFGYDPRLINSGNQLPLDAPPIQRVPLGATVTIPVESSHYAVREERDVLLRWRLSGMDTLGGIHDRLDSGLQPIDFPHRQVVLAHTLNLKMPDRPMLAMVEVEAISRDGHVLAQNFVHILVTSGYPTEREDHPRSLIRRLRPESWAGARWSGGYGGREDAARADACCGRGKGYFRWDFPVPANDLHRARRVRLLLEASSCRTGTSQTDFDRWPSDFQISVNGVLVHKTVLSNHPHDARGTLSYLRGGKGAYGFLINTSIEGPALDEVRRASPGEHIRVRCEVPEEANRAGGLVVYGAECGRSPICPTVIVDL